MQWHVWGFCDTTLSPVRISFFDQIMISKLIKKRKISRFFLFCIENISKNFYRYFRWISRHIIEDFALRRLVRPGSAFLTQRWQKWPKIGHIGNEKSPTSGIFLFYGRIVWKLNQVHFNRECSDMSEYFALRRLVRTGSAFLIPKITKNYQK